MYTKDIYQAYINGDMEEWKSIINKIDQQNSDNHQLDNLYELALLKYGYIGYCIEYEKKDEAERLIDSATEDIEAILDTDPEHSRAYALWGGIYGLRIQLSPYKAIFLGPRSMNRIEKSLELDSLCAEGWVEMANSLYYRPSTFGGDKEEAIVTYQKSIRCFEHEPDRIKTSWHYLNTIISLAKAYEGTEQFNKALLQYERLLTIEPEFILVRDELYPNLVKKIQY